MATMKTVEVFDKEGQLIAIIEGTDRAANKYNVTSSSISRACRGNGRIATVPGLTFRYGKRKPKIGVNKQWAYCGIM